MLLHTPWAQFLALVLLAIPLGMIGGHAGFTKSATTTLSCLALFAIFLLVRAFAKTVLFWWIVWGLAALIWAGDVFGYLF